MSRVFSKQSRYRRITDVTVPDVRGRMVFAKDFRPLPDVTGTFMHTVDSGDRLDHLAWRYYGQPLQYWRICDANPGFLSPLALVGQEALVTTLFPVTVRQGEPPWSVLVGAVSGTVGVEDVRVVESATLEEQRRAVDGAEVTVTVERISRAVVVTYNRGNLEATALAAVIDAAGFTVGPAADGGQVGRPIVVPVAAGG